MKCRGTSKDTYGLGCNTEQENRKLGLGLDCRCYQEFLYNTPNGINRIKRSALKFSKPRLDFEKIEKEHKNRKGLTSILESVKSVCHEYIRLRDKNKPCISCGTQWHKDFQAGHFYKAELFSTIKFNELNINAQCVQCNIRKEGNESEYRVNLPSRIGEDAFKALDELGKLDHSVDFKWDREELKKIRAYYRNQLKELKT